MKTNTSKILLIVTILALLVGGCSNQVTSIISGMASDLFLISLFVTILVVIIFLMNRFITKGGYTDERSCSIVGVIIFPLIFMLALGTKFNFDWLTIITSIIVGGLVGWFSYVLDELILSFWENRPITVPGTLGLILGIWVIITMVTHVWLEGDMYITHKACAKRVVIERYTEHVSYDSTGTHYSYTWDFHTSAERIVFGSNPPELYEGKDYNLGYGYNRTKDRVGREEFYYFIGGHLFSEKSNQWKPFRWLRLAKKINFNLNEVRIVQSNYFGNPINNAGEHDVYAYLPEKSNNPPLPTVSDLPPAETGMKLFSMTWMVIKLMFIEEEYRILLYINSVIAGILILLAIFVPTARVPVLVFVVCSSVIILILMLLVAARTGSLGGVSRGFGGGRSGGGGGRRKYREE